MFKARCIVMYARIHVQRVEGREHSSGCGLRIILPGRPSGFVRSDAPFVDIVKTVQKSPVVVRAPRVLGVGVARASNGTKTI